MKMSPAPHDVNTRIYSVSYKSERSLQANCLSKYDVHVHLKKYVNHDFGSEESLTKYF